MDAQQRTSRISGSYPLSIQYKHYRVVVLPRSGKPHVFIIGEHKVSRGISPRNEVVEVDMTATPHTLLWDSESKL